MAYIRDNDRYTRGVGAIAARDQGNRRRLMFRQARARALSERDAQLARYTYGPQGGLGAMNTGREQPPPKEPGGGSGGSGGGVPNPFATGSGSGYQPPTRSPFLPPLPPLYPTKPPPTIFGQRGGVIIGGSAQVPTRGGGIIVDPIPPPQPQPVLTTGGTITGGGGGGVNTGPIPPDMIPPDMGPDIEPGALAPQTGIDMKKVVIVGALALGAYLLYKHGKAGAT